VIASKSERVRGFHRSRGWLSEKAAVIRANRGEKAPVDVADLAEAGEAVSLVSPVREMCMFCGAV